LSGHTGPRPWTPQLGGKRAYRTHLRKDRSPGESCHSIPSVKQALPPFCDDRCWIIGTNYTQRPLVRVALREPAWERSTGWPLRSPALATVMVPRLVQKLSNVSREI
jgi:hypothetical protein